MDFVEGLTHTGLPNCPLKHYSELYILHKLYWDVATKNCSGFSQNHHLPSTELLSRPPYRHTELFQPLNNALRTERKSCEPLTTYWRSQAPWAKCFALGLGAHKGWSCVGFQSLQWRSHALPPSQLCLLANGLRLLTANETRDLLLHRHLQETSSLEAESPRLSCPHGPLQPHIPGITGNHWPLHMCSVASPDLEFGSGVRFHTKSISKINKNKNSCASKDLNQESRKTTYRMGGNIWKS